MRIQTNDDTATQEDGDAADAAHSNVPAVVGTHRETGSAIWVTTTQTDGRMLMIFPAQQPTQITPPDADLVGAGNCQHE